MLHRSLHFETLLALECDGQTQLPPSQSCVVHLSPNSCSARHTSSTCTHSPPGFLLCASWHRIYACRVSFVVFRRGDLIGMQTRCSIHRAHRIGQDSKSMRHMKLSGMGGRRPKAVTSRLLLICIFLFLRRKPTLRASCKCLKQASLSESGLGQNGCASGQKHWQNTMASESAIAPL